MFDTIMSQNSTAGHDGFFLLKIVADVCVLFYIFWLLCSTDYYITVSRPFCLKLPFLFLSERKQEKFGSSQNSSSSFITSTTL